MRTPFLLLLFFCLFSLAGSAQAGPKHQILYVHESYCSNGSYANITPGKPCVGPTRVDVVLRRSYQFRLNTVRIIHAGRSYRPVLTNGVDENDGLTSALTTLRGRFRQGSVIRYTISVRGYAPGSSRLQTFTQRVSERIGDSDNHARG